MPYVLQRAPSEPDANNTSQTGIGDGRRATDRTRLMPARCDAPAVRQARDADRTPTASVTADSHTRRRTRPHAPGRTAQLNYYSQAFFSSKRSQPNDLSHST